MPRNVRNFWIELDVDGRKSCITTGPRSKDGGFKLTVYQREKGNIVKALSVFGSVNQLGKLETYAYAPLETELGDAVSFITER